MSSYFPLESDSSNLGGRGNEYQAFGPVRQQPYFSSPSRSAASYSHGGPSSFEGYQPRHPVPARPPSYFEQLAGIGLGVGNLLAENLLSHPCVVLRRQCQVNNRAGHYHLTPFTFAPVIYNLEVNQGIFCLWKGVSGTVVLRGLCFLSDNVFGDLLGLPKEVTRFSSFNRICKHLALKTITFTLTAPFAIASFIETVESVGASEPRRVFDCIRDGLARLAEDLSGHRSSRRLPIWILLGPSVTLSLSHYIIASITRYGVHSLVKKKVLSKPAQQRTLFDDFFPDLFAAFASNLLADAILFPLETVVHRLYLQGTRTLVDNLDSGTGVISITTRYEGFVDCFRSIVREEGFGGLYKAFGALMLQYALHMLVLRLLRVVFEQLEETMRPKPAPEPGPSRQHRPAGEQD